MVKILELTETTGDDPTAPNGVWKTLRTNSGACNVMLRPFRISSLGRHVQPVTMIGFKQIEFFDHTRLNHLISGRFSWDYVAADLEPALSWLHRGTGRAARQTRREGADKWRVQS